MVASMSPPTASSPFPAISHPLSDLHAILAPHFAALDGELAEQVDAFEPEVRDLARYCLGCSGKRLRSMLVFLSGWRTGGMPDGELVRAAAVIEMVHLATLVHDDIMDRADLRRGRPTVSARAGDATAVLLGDALFAHAVVLSTRFPTTSICRRVAEATRRVCTGEIIQTLGATVDEPGATAARYWRIIELKTAELFQVSCVVGAELAGRPAPIVQTLGEFGRSFGRAYQVYDDLTDFAGSRAEAGKTLGTDLASGKITLPLQTLCDRLPSGEGRALFEALRRGETPAWSQAVTQMRALGVFDAVATTAKNEIAAAEAHLAACDGVECTPLLGRLANALRQQVDHLLAQRGA